MDFFMFKVGRKIILWRILGVNEERKVIQRDSKEVLNMKKPRKCQAIKDGI
mgnify:CR=1 FL=1